MHDEAPKMARIIFILGIMGFLANGDNYAVAPLILDMSRDLGISISETAMSVTSYMMCFGFFTVFVGPLADRYGKTRIVNIAAFGTAIFSILSAFSHNLTTLVILRAFNGAFGSGIFPVSLAYIGENSRDTTQHKYLARFFGMMFLGGATATAIGGAIAQMGSWRMVYFVYGFLELIVAFIMLKGLNKAPGVIGRLDLMAIYREAFRNRALIKTTGTIFLIGFSVFGTFTYSGKYVQSITGYSILQVGLLLSFFGIGTVIGGRHATRLRYHFNHRYVPGAALLGAFCLAVFPFLHAPAVIAMALFGFGFAFISIHSTLVTTAQSLLPHMRGTVMSLVSFNLFGGGALGTYANGLILDRFGIQWLFAGATLLMLLILLIAVAILDLRVKAPALT
jgi:predicted MFS family arabinose efflux permease